MQSNASHMANNVENRMAFALPVFNLDRLAMVIPTSSDSSVKDTFRCTSSKSKLTISFSFIVSSLEYCLLIIDHNLSKNNKNILQINKSCYILYSN